jgi:hypothetical protein
MPSFAGFEPQVGEIRAVRTFRIGPGGELFALFSRTPWAEGINTASCRLAAPAKHPDGSPHQAPEPDCSCGFYAYGSVDAAREYPFAEHVLAVVACWGGVIAGTRGLRAQHCRIEALWLSDAVPVDLAAQLRERYPSVAVFRDRDTLLAEYPLTALDCYTSLRQRRWTRRALAVAFGGAVALGALPFRWIDGVQDGRILWGAVLGLCVLAAIVLSRRPPNDVAARRQRMLFFALSLWLVAPTSGLSGLIFLRLPLLQIVVLTYAQRRVLQRAASRFPALIE